MFNTSDVIKIVAIALSTIILTVSAIKAVAGEEHDQGTSAGAAADLTEQDIVTALESRIPGAAAFLLAHGHDVWWCMGNCGNAIGDICQHACIANVIAGHHPVCPTACGD